MRACTRLGGDWKQPNRLDADLLLFNRIDEFVCMLSERGIRKIKLPNQPYALCNQIAHTRGVLPFSAATRHGKYIFRTPKSRWKTVIRSLRGRARNALRRRWSIGLQARLLWRYRPWVRVTLCQTMHEKTTARWQLYGILGFSDALLIHASVIEFNYPAMLSGYHSWDPVYSCMA